ncbi:MAG: hypothetical protein Q3979_04050 [Actinomycetaceae bacterium]|nr:hypothetical protein [Actinomycetaceae bacterium]
MTRHMIWEVGENQRDHDCSDLSAEQVADRLAAMLTDPTFFDGERCFSLGVRALDEEATSLAAESPEALARGNYMQCLGDTEYARIEVRTTTPEGYKHVLLEPLPPHASPFHESGSRRGSWTKRTQPDPSTAEFSPQQAAEIFRHYILTGQVPAHCRQTLLEESKNRSRRFWRR